MITHVTIGNAGRFGNQMFQLAALIGIAEKNGYDIKIPIENTGDRKSTRLNSSHPSRSRMPSSA